MTMDGYSQTPKEERIKILQSVMPEIFDEGKIDWEKLRAALGEDVNFAALTHCNTIVNKKQYLVAVSFAKNQYLYRLIYCICL